MRGCASHVCGFCGASRPAPRHEGIYMRGFAPHPDREPLYMGLRPMPHLGIFFGKKIPKNPKKPNCIGFKPSNTDSEQGCRRQPCFFARRRQHGTATARSSTVHPAPAVRRPHPPLAPTAPCALTAATAVLPRTIPSPAPALMLQSSAVFFAPTPASPEPARLPAEILKPRTFSFLQSVSNFVVNLPNVSKKCEGATVPAVAALTLPRPV